MAKRFPYTLILIVFFVATTVPAADSRTALRAVVATCELNYNVAGAAYPCLTVKEAADPLASYAVLREPMGAHRTILAPLAQVAGVEDPRLLASNAPNYFSMAWDERSLVIPPGRDQWNNVALAINASIYRTQDHLHIHMGCLAAEVAKELSAAKVSTEGFRRLNAKLKGRIYWARFFPGDDPANINPFKIVAEDVFLAKRFMGGVTIAMIGRDLNGTRGFIILAFTMAQKPGQLTAAGDLIDPKCRS